MAFIDYYKTMGVEKTATAKEIKSAFRKLARKHHPDVNQGSKDSEQKFKEINEAYQVLQDTEKRKKYDKYGENWEGGEAQEQAQRQHNSQRQSQQQSSQQNYSQQDYSDFFGSMFGGGGASSSGYERSTKFKGQDYNAELHLNLKDVYTAQKQVLTVNNAKIRLTIPAGVEDGQVIKISGKGAAGMNGGPNGDLYLQFIIKNDTAFKRVGNDLYQTVDLDLYTAILGGEITVDTFDGKVKLKVKPETENETKVKLKGKGFPLYKTEDKFGDLIISYHITTPTNLSEEEIKLFKELQNLKAKQ